MQKRGFCKRVAVGLARPLRELVTGLGGQLTADGVVGARIQQQPQAVCLAVLRRKGGSRVALSVAGLQAGAVPQQHAQHAAGDR